MDFVLAFVLKLFICIQLAFSCVLTCILSLSYAVIFTVPLNLPVPFKSMLCWLPPHNQYNKFYSFPYVHIIPSIWVQIFGCFVCLIMDIQIA